MIVYHVHGLLTFGARSLFSSRATHLLSWLVRPWPFPRLPLPKQRAWIAVAAPEASTPRCISYILSVVSRTYGPARVVTESEWSPVLHRPKAQRQAVLRQEGGPRVEAQAVRQARPGECLQWGLDWLSHVPCRALPCLAVPCLILPRALPCAAFVVYLV